MAKHMKITDKSGEFITDHEDVERMMSGCVCPCCGSSDIESYDGDVGTMFCEDYLCCHTCGSKWRNVYFIQYIEIESDGRFEERN